MWNWIISHWIVSGVSVLTGLGVIIARWKEVMEFYRWCVGLRDAPVLRLFEDRARKARLMGSNYVALNILIEDVASALGRSNRSVEKSLLRLEKQGKVMEQRDGWGLRSDYPGNGTDSPRFRPRFW